MKRDMDLCRKILMGVEECSDPWGPRELSIDGYSDAEISYHIKLLCEAGLVEGEDCSCLGPNGFSWDVSSLTWQGHEFLEKAKNDSIWEKAKKVVTEKTGGIAIDLLSPVLTDLLKKAISGVKDHRN